MNNSEMKFEYDIQKRARAGTRATLRAVVAGYLIYLAWQIVKGVRTGITTMSHGVAYAAAAFFTLAAIAFVVYLVRTWRADLEAARLPMDEESRDGGELDEKNPPAEE
ncbi:MAG: hypothetical protein II885_09160 [Oscillospiraceae bacterium]|nr:hypothetical protein [Oscillospiraceae bacterium]